MTNFVIPSEAARVARSNLRALAAQSRDLVLPADAQK